MIPQRRYDTHLAYRIMQLAHYGQVDKNGEPYTLHPEGVVALLMASRPSHWDQETSELAECVGYLHDVCEDTVVTLLDLRRFGMPDEVMTRVDMLTKKKGETLAAYYQRIRTDEVATRVKLADVAHNSMEDRLAKITDVATQKRLREKYAVAKMVLTAPLE